MHLISTLFPLTPWQEGGNQEVGSATSVSALTSVPTEDPYFPPSPRSNHQPQQCGCLAPSQRRDLAKEVQPPLTEVYSFHVFRRVCYVGD